MNLGVDTGGWREGQMENGYGQAEPYGWAGGWMEVGE